MDVDIDESELQGEGQSPGEGAAELNLNNERLDCENMDDVTRKVVEIIRPSFFTIVFRFFGNIVVDVVRTVF
ncbi:uncharacterized protein LOC115634247 [Scaptodrosophila lebanonensis]|uniref:Uncharacterized protein LOC115634247 n=1 Tax=Drosophila lebanonensis TaxID=7225 RepID=A0A6J2UGU6_DROLE|nr:uncharacterized protein LOC115634247 [Scaptodrosophila lebanonensis]